MTTEHSKTNSKNLQGADEAQCARAALITVKEAAHWLGVSRSTVYRFDRTNGALQFISKGRWIFIEQASLESYVANLRGIRADDCELPVENSLRQQLATVTQTNSDTDELKVVTAAPTTIPNASRLASGSGCQRELIILPHRQPFVVLFIS